MSVAEMYVDFKNKFVTIYVQKSVYECWLNSRQFNFVDTEQFGVLIGSRIKDESTLWIEECTTPKPGDVSSRTHFTLRDSFHQKAIDKAFKNSEGVDGYIGTWHTHPQSEPEPSGVDIVDWLGCIQRNPDRQLIFVIVGNNHVNIYLNANNKFEKLTRNIHGK